MTQEAIQQDELELEEQEEVNNDEVQELEENQDSENQEDDSKKEKVEDDKGEEESLYLDFKQETLPTEKVKKRISAETRQRFEQNEKIRKLNEENLQLKKQMHESKKPAEIQKPSEDLAYEDPQKYAQQLDNYYKNQNTSNQWQQEAKTLEQEYNSQLMHDLSLLGQNYVDNAAKQGIKKELAEQSLVTVANQVKTMVLSEQEQNASQQLFLSILNQENGAKLLDHFSRKPDELRDILRLNPYQAGSQLGLLSQRLSKPKNINSSAPPPDDPVKNSTSNKGEDPWLKGATFE